MNWDAYFLDLCKVVATKSKDRSTKVGCVIVGPEHNLLSTGYNGFPRGVNDDKEEWHTRPTKYRVTQHAEVNAITNAARHGVALKGCTFYLPWHPCAACAGAIINVGAKDVVIDGNYKMTPELKERWKEDLHLAATLLVEGNVYGRYGWSSICVSPLE